MNRLFVVNKPIFVSSNNYMYYIKRKFNTKKVGFSGTLDPFATGCLIVATGKFTKLFQYLQKSPKSYRATMWLGASSDTLDIEHISKIENTKELNLKKIEIILSSIIGKLEYLPPKFSAKKINGKRAYNLARDGEEFELKSIKSTIYNIKLLNYNHPFLTFEIEVSEGAYIRSIAQEIAKRLGVNATLSALHRINEGAFKFENEKALNPYENLKLKKNIFLGENIILELGKKVNVNEFKTKEDGEYLVETKNYYCIIKIEQGKVKYQLNNLPKEWNV